MLANNGASLVARGAGYDLSYAIAEDNLKLGRTVIADSVNPIRITREAWQNIAKRSGIASVDVVVICSDREQHQNRIKARPLETRGSNWPEIVGGEFDIVDDAAIVIDTSGRTVEQCLDSLCTALDVRMPGSS